MRPIWDPSGQPAYKLPILGHVEPGCTPHKGLIWVAHMGPKHVCWDVVNISTLSCLICICICFSCNCYMVCFQKDI